MKYEAMTGAAHTSASTSIFQRPRRVRCSSATTASCGDGNECTVSPSGWSRMPCLAAGEDELEPDIEDGDHRGDGPPLEGVAVVFFSAAAGARPLPQQTFGGGTGLLRRQRKQGQPGFRAEPGQVEILPDWAFL